MDKENGKSWERPWTTKEMREHSANWNLAGDAGLLNHLQEFSQNLLSRTHATEVALDSLMEDMKTASINVQNVTNVFLSLANTQFVENRVYDDDEKETPSEEKKVESENVKTKEEQENEVYMNVKKALEMGMSLLETHFEAVEVSASDSDEEESSASMGRLILKPKNPYLSRPLPCLIGSQEFMDDDNVGLGDISSDTEESPDQNIVLSSESDEDIAHDDLEVTPKRQTLSSSDMENSEPESDRSESIIKQKKMKGNSSAEIIDRQVEGEGEQDMFGQESPPEADVMSIMKGGLKSAFSDELASKFGTNKSQLPSQDKDDLFAPLSETEDDTGLFGKTSHSFSDEKGLFGEVNDWKDTSNSLWGNKSMNKATTGPDTNKSSENDKLFGSDNFDDALQSDIFNHSKQNLNKSLDVSQNVAVKTSTPQNVTVTVDSSRLEKKDESEDIFNKKIKDTTSSLFDNDDLEEDLFATPPAVVISTEQSLDLPKKKPPGLIREISKEDLFGDISPVIQHDSTANDASRLAERSLSRHESSSGIGITADNIVHKGLESNSQEQREGATGNSLSFDSNLFQGTSTKIENNNSNKSSVFQEEKNSDSLFNKPRQQDQPSRSVTGGNISGSKLFPSLKTKSKKSMSLFDDSDSGDDELLFSSTSSTSSRSRRSQGSGDILSNVGEKVLSKKGLFEDNTLFGSESKEEPEVDIFKPLNESKTSGGSLNKRNDNDKSDLLDGNIKIASSIFDDINDLDDIFAVPKPSVGNPLDNKTKSFQSIPEKSLLFSEDSSITNEDQPFINNSKSECLKIESTKNILDSENSSENQTNQPRNQSTFPVHTHKDVLITNEEIEKSKSAEQHNSSESTSVLSGSLSLNENQKAIEPKSSDHVQQLSSSQENSEITNPLSDQTASNSNNLTDIKKINNKHLANVKAEPPRSLNIRKTTNVLFDSPSNNNNDDGDDSDDLFETLPTNKTLPNQENEQSNNNLNENTINSSSFGKLLEDFKVASEVNAIDNSERSGEGKLNSPSERPFNAERTTINSEKVPSPNKQLSKAPGSISSKVFIDPRALLPGAKRPPVTSTSDGTVGFEKPAETTSILHSAGKERVKIQVKRRPQTRKARQEALRASYIESNDLDAALSSQITNNIKDVSEEKNISSNDSNIVNNISIDKVLPEFTEKTISDVQRHKNLEKSLPPEEKSESSLITNKSDTSSNFLSDCINSNSNPLSPLTDEEDLFAVPHELTSDEANSKEISISTKNLFGGAPVLSPLDNILDSKPGHSTDSIFDNINTEDDFLSVKKAAGQQITVKADEKIDDAMKNSFRKSSQTSITSESQIPSGHSPQPFLPILSDNKLFEENSESRKGLFDKSKDLEDDDSLFSSVKGIEPPRQNKQGSIVDHEKSENKIFSEAHSALFSASSMATSVGESSRTIVFEENDIFGESGSKLPSTKTILTDENFLNKASDVLQRQGSDDLFTQSGKLKILCDTSSSVHSEKTKSQKPSLFEDDSTETDDLFGTSSVIVTKKTAASSSNYLFSDSKVKGPKELLFDDGDDDIFTVGSSKSHSQSASSLLTGDDFSGQKESDDLFSKKTTYIKQTSSKQSSVQKILPKEDLFEDPLMVIKK